MGRGDQPLLPSRVTLQTRRDIHTQALSFSARFAEARLVVDTSTAARATL